MRSKIETLAVLFTAFASCALCQSDEADHGRHHRDRPGVVLFGGDASGTVLSDTWVWNGRSWEEKFPNTSPPARSNGAMAYDHAHHEVVLFGGGTESGPLADTWVWNGHDWKQKFPSTSPSARVYFSMAYDANHREVVLYSGLGPGLGAFDMGDTWVWDGENWHQKFPAHSPTFRINSSMASDPANCGVILFGGFEYFAMEGTSDTWIWNGSDWQEQDPADKPDGSLGEFAATYDAMTHKPVLFGRSYDPLSNEVVPVTWVWNGSDWILKHPENSPTPGALLAYDSFRRKVVSFDNNSNTFIFGGAQWRDRTPSAKPPARDGFALASDVVPDDCFDPPFSLSDDESE